jgi:hypothetical protein
MSGPAKRIRLAASTACVLCDALGSDNGVLDIIDLRQPTQPNRMGSHAVSGRVHGLAVSGAHAWIAALSSGLIAVDISRPNAPTRVSRTPLAGAALDVAIVANSAFVLHTRDQRTADIDVFDLRNAATPRRIGSCHLDSMCLAIEPVGDRLIFSARSESETGYLVGMLDIVDPSRPALVGSLQVQAGLIHPLTATSFYSAGPNGVNLVRFAGGSGPTP